MHTGMKIETDKVPASLDGPSEKSIPDFSETAQRRPTRGLSRSLKRNNIEGDCLAGTLRVATRLVPAADGN